jgi:hypothetical protein
VIAQGGAVMVADMGKPAQSLGHFVGPADPLGQVVFVFTSYNATPAARAKLQINNHGIIGHLFILLPESCNLPADMIFYMLISWVIINS